KRWAVFDLIHANCIDVLRGMPDKTVECIVTDPPYGIGVQFGDYRDDVENLKRLIADALPEMRRVAHRVVLTSGIRNSDLNPDPTWTLCWAFGGGARGRWGFNHWQPVLVYGSDPLHSLKMVHTDRINTSAQTLEDRTGHPCPKPLGFVRKLLNRVAPS